LATYLFAAWRGRSRIGISLLRLIDDWAEIRRSFAMFGSSSQKGLNRRYDSGRRLSMELLEARLALTWVAVPPASIPVPTDAVTVTLNSQNGATGAASIASSEVDYYSFATTTTGSYTISTATPSSGLDTVLGIFSATGQRLAYNDDISYPTNTDSRMTVTLTAGSHYFIGVTNYSLASRGAYNWTIVGPAATTGLKDDSYENNDSLNTAYNFGTLTAAKTVNTLVMADGVDWYRFTTAATGTSSNSISISFLNSQGNLQLALYSATGAFITASTGTGNSESISLSGLTAGTYYVDVYGYGGAQNPNYSLTITPPTQTTTNPSSGFQITLNMTGLTTSQQAVFQQAAARWSQVITGDLPNATYRGIAVDDVLINASAVAIDGVNGILGQAAPDAFRAGSNLPYHGFMEFDSADMASLQQSGLLLSVILHEMGHVLGIGTIWSAEGLLQGAGSANPIFTGANATAQYNQIFGASAAGVPVENMGGPGTADAHWRESVLGNELMTGYANVGANPLSKITIGSLADLGYAVNYAAADPYSKPSGVIAAARPIGGTAAALRPGFVNLAFADGLFAGPLAYSLPAINDRADSQRAGLLFSQSTANLSERATDSAIENVVTAANNSVADGSEQTARHTVDDIDRLWSSLGESWNPLAEQTAA
jgi:hypothetical protein